MTRFTNRATAAVLQAPAIASALRAAAIESPAMAAVAAPRRRVATAARWRVALRQATAAGRRAAPVLALLATALLPVSTASAQATREPFPAPIDREAGVIVVDVVEFASIPDVGGEAARMMRLVDEPVTRRLFVNDMRGPIYSVSYDGNEVTLYVDVDDSRWGVAVQSRGRERGVQNFAFHPDFARPGAPGYGKFYTWTDTRNTDPAADFTPGGGRESHHTVLLEWTARDATAATYDGGPPRELMRFEQPFPNHNGGHLAFNPLAEPGDPDYGMLYIGVGDGGSGGDPLKNAQNLGSGFGKILRIDPLGSNSANGKYGIPADNPFAGDGDDGTLGEIFAYGVRNPQRFGWDPATGHMFLADIGQNTVEEVSLVTPGANLGWNVWEGSFQYAGRDGVIASNVRGSSEVTYPVVEYAHGDPLLGRRAAVTGIVVYRAAEIPQLTGHVLFGDFPSGEIFYFDADDPPEGGNLGFHRVLLRPAGGEPTTLLELIRAKNAAQGRQPAQRADLRFGEARDGRVFLMNKHDGTIRLLVPAGG
ncbi:MAG TPA: PQQ-dependent sugar dehydrogenase [Longimicrobiales bacterium]